MPLKSLDYALAVLRGDGSSGTGNAGAEAVSHVYDAELKVRAMRQAQVAREVMIRRGYNDLAQFEAETLRILESLAANTASLLDAFAAKVCIQTVTSKAVLGRVAEVGRAKEPIKTAVTSKQLVHNAANAAEPPDQVTYENTHQDEDALSNEMLQQPNVAAEPVASLKKMITSVALLSQAEFESLPKYLVNRLTLDKINSTLSDFNKLVSNKYVSLKIPHAKMTKPQRDRYWEHKKSCNDATKGKAFLMEREVKENWWVATSTKAAAEKSGGSFKLDPNGRSVLALIRHLGRIKEVRGGGDTRIVIL
ncbi:hypothetical protein BC830DRAFT_1127462 [Chytriomyces sp. MP71]|nr:hypothetical protein BC830DRAFT_1127462 [Chytriomyces sp. MP71]